MSDSFLKRLRIADKNRKKKWSGKKKLGPTFAALELAGEVGELCNFIKKAERHKKGMAGGSVDIQAIKEELADVLICLDLLCAEYNIDLEQATIEKFNKTSVKYGFDERLS